MYRKECLGFGSLCPGEGMVGRSVFGTVFGCRVAIRIMRAVELVSAALGHIYCTILIVQRLEGCLLSQTYVLIYSTPYLGYCEKME